ncbi:fructose-specific PTS transporter subunit EIIC [Bacillus cereus]|uniref:PTS system, Fru family, IIC component n=2 Tax=Bacillus cereus group TaxID=86661 RepID=A0A9W5L156_BACCE|nr:MULTISPECIES: fructose-specific PTS transporter subunit EIIC [Bacillus cereus group]MEB8730360.1 fructose-specific PTS transporter subunit EIIC [Bacillus cereus]EEM46620.1 PTS system, IIbc component [Bacillus thuringiensis serovar pakistani str. T13001]EJR74394.1 PTS system, Fru family, IIC component [Bacillus cereus VD154]KIU72491.1 PTS system fructose-specific transporter subunit IIABC [Bacillus thuringiensis Sbt003]MEB8748563.1 fructose-specific PTS transporter subunit EIIC [Bacillus cer
MKITELLKRDTVIMDLTASNKEAVIDELVEKLNGANRLNSKTEFKEAILKREAQSTTGIGEGIAIPHAKTKAVKQPSICFGRSVSGINYESLDGQPAHLFFMIAASEGANNTHLETLSRLSTLLMDEGFRKQLLEAKDESELLQLFDEKENEKEEEIEVAKPEGNEPYVLAVTACPTGIAHTYMAADSLKAKATELGIAIKVETNGSTGIKNGLTKEDIERATAIIVAADKQVEMNRFAGKHVIQVPVADGIRKTENLLKRAVKQDAPIFKGVKEDGKSESIEGEKGLGIYKHLMSGVSNILPFVVGGGILIALAFSFGGIKAEGPLAELFMSIGGGKTGAFLFLVPILAGFIASSIADRPGFMPGVVGGFLAANANAGFLGGLIAGFLAGYVVLGLKRLFSRLPVQLEGIKPVLLYPVFGLLITGVVMQKVVIPPVVALNEMLTGWLNGLNGTNAILLGLILGGMMAIDMGGPINKAAFTFGIAAIEAQNFGVHSAVMAGGMVPPLAIAFATTFFKSKFTEAERKSGLTNYIMGASFITEGAIPFAAADPVRVIVSCVVGSSIAGALSMLFQITLPAPHGGLFVIALVNKPLLYIFSILIGTIVSAVMLGVWKKKVQ